MFFQASKLISLPVGELDTNSKVAEVKQLVIDPKNSRLVALLVKTGGWFGEQKVLAVSDILDFDHSAIIIKSAENLVDLDEIIKAKEIIDQGINFIGLRARTESGKSLGKIFDFVLSVDKLKIIKFYTHSFFSEKILPINKVIKIDKREIVFSDDVVKPKKSRSTRKMREAATGKATV